MNRQIEIDEEIWYLLENNVKTFNETPNSVLRRLLGLDSTVQDQSNVQRSLRLRKSTKRGYGKLSNKYYRQPILEALRELGGKGTVDDVLSRVLIKVRPRLSQIDFEKTTANLVRWKNTAQWERYKMVLDGILKSNSPRGIWELEEEYKEEN